jgi:hypothetical protein
MTDAPESLIEIRARRRQEFLERAASVANEVRSSPDTFDQVMIQAVLGLVPDGEGAELPYQFIRQRDPTSAQIMFDPGYRIEATTILEALGVPYKKNSVSTITLSATDLKLLAPLFNSNPSVREPAQVAYLERMDAADRADPAIARISSSAPRETVRR